ncbi:hypothetical protein IFM89_018308 [Coptis chinensis]|uniref:KIB1-4 beta-propeller domain-containing protein n=1 Tax=Coptis chinensis TaxID=261450 RepID=A0A835LIY2_9MAGN|nr:hypothetical protein IFM89_018308 [Coptis chinensis]
MLTKRENDTSSSENSVGHRTFFSFSSKKLFNIQLLEEAQGRRCWGSPYGWLVTMGLDRNIHLLNPLSKIQLSLPSQRTFPRDLQDGFRKPETLCQVFLHKFALSSNPSFSNQSCVVMTIYGGINRVAFAAPGDEAWTPVKRSPLGNAADIISFNGHFYAVNAYGYLSICELSTKTPHTIDIAPPPFDVECTSMYKFYLMEISGVLHLIVRNLDADDPDGCPDYFYDSESTDDFEFDDNASTENFDSNDNASTDDIDSDDNSSTDGLDSDDNASNDDFETGNNASTEEFEVDDNAPINDLEVDDILSIGDFHYYTVGFKVYKFDFQKKIWSDAPGLADHALFVGTNTSFSISTSTYPKFKANCIYFTDDHSEQYHKRFCDMGVYNYGTNLMEEPLYSSDDILSKFSRPSFFMPSL